MFEELTGKNLETIKNIVNKALARGVILAMMFFVGLAFSTDTSSFRDHWVGIARYGAYTGILVCILIMYVTVRVVLIPSRLKETIVNSFLASLALTIFFCTGIEHGYNNPLYLQKQVVALYATRTAMTFAIQTVVGSILVIATICGSVDFLWWILKPIESELLYSKLKRTAND